MDNIMNNNKTTNNETITTTKTTKVDRGFNVDISKHLKDGGITLKDYLTYSKEFSKVISTILLEVYTTEEKEKIKTLVSLTSKDFYKHNLCKFIIEGVESFYNITNREGFIEDTNGYFRVLNVIINLMFKGVITSTEEKGRISKYVGDLKKELGFLKINTPDIVLENNQYLGDVIEKYLQDELGTTIDKVNDTDIKLLINSPVGTGKSYMLGMFSNIVILKDTLPLVRNSYRELQTSFPNKKIYMEHGTSTHLGTYEDGSIIVSTYNQVKKLDRRLSSKWLFILDEEHKLITDLTFRKSTLVDVLYVQQKRGKYISISATPKVYSPLSYTKTLKVKKKSTEGKRKTITLIGEKESLEGKMYNILEDKTYKREETTLFYVIQNTKTVERIVNKITKEYPNLKVGKVTSDYVNGKLKGMEEEGIDTMTDISTGEFSEYDVVISTPLLREGVSLSTDRENVIYLIEDNPDILTITQQHDRVRQGMNIKVYIKSRDYKKLRQDREELFRGDYYKSLRKEKENRLGTNNNMILELYKQEYIKCIDRRDEDMYEFRELDKKNLSTISSLESILFRNNIYPTGDGGFLTMDLDGIMDKYNQDKMLERTDWEGVKRYMKQELDFSFDYDGGTYKVDNKTNNEEEKRIKEQWMEEGIDYVFNTFINLDDEEKKKQRLTRNKETSNILFQYVVMNSITNYTTEEMKKVIRTYDTDNVGVLIMNWFISRRNTPLTNDKDRHSYEIIKEHYFKNNETLWMGLELSKLLEVGETYTKDEVKDLLRDCKGGPNKKGYKLSRPLRTISNVFDVEEKEVTIGGRGGKRTTTYTILGLNVDKVGFTDKIKTEYLSGKVEDVFNVLTENEIDTQERLQNPYLVKTFGIFN